MLIYVKSAGHKEGFPRPQGRSGNNFKLWKGCCRWSCAFGNGDFKTVFDRKRAPEKRFGDALSFVGRRQLLRSEGRRAGPLGKRNCLSLAEVAGVAGV